jgi:hypothetical protein
MTGTDHELMASFEAGTLDAESFHHRDHVRLAWLHLGHYPAPVALDRFTSGLRRLAQAAGQADRYHETVTWAYLLLINERMERFGRTLPWPEFARLNPEVLTWRPSILDAYYPADVLRSDLARRVFVLPGPTRR